MSLPGPPRITSLPSPPWMVSSPFPPWTVSLPWPPRTRSLPPLAWMVSSPPRAQITSRWLVPRMTLSSLLPVMVQFACAEATPAIATNSAAINAPATRMLSLLAMPVLLAWTDPCVTQATLAARASGAHHPYAVSLRFLRRCLEPQALRTPSGRSSENPPGRSSEDCYPTHFLCGGEGGHSSPQSDE